jgi:hypothetical protein
LARTFRFFCSLGLSLAFALGVAAAPITIDFEDVGAALGAESFENASGGFDSGGAAFANEFNDFGGGCCWNGWLYSNKTDTTTSGFSNDQSAFAGSGAGGSATYGVAFLGGATTITFDSEKQVLSGDFTNTTYAALAMQNGEFVAKQFGGASGDDPDFLLLEIQGYDALGSLTGSVELYLADYRFADNSLDFILDAWTSVDLSSLGAVKQLDFTLSGSDNDPMFGLNTPAYFALDNLVVAPEPGTGALLAFGLVGIGARRRRCGR